MARHILLTGKDADEYSNFKDGPGCFVGGFFIVLIIIGAVTGVFKDDNTSGSSDKEVVEENPSSLVEPVSSSPKDEQTILSVERETTVQEDIPVQKSAQEEVETEILDSPSEEESVSSNEAEQERKLSRKERRALRKAQKEAEKAEKESEIVDDMYSY